MKLKAILFSVILLAVGGSALATTTVTGTLQNLGTGTVGQAAFVRFWLRGCGGNQPRVSGTAVIAPSQGGVFFFDFAANSSGNVSGTLYSTRDVTGLLGGDITCGTSTTSVWYGMQVFVGGKGGPEIPVHALNTATLNISSVTPITVNPVVAAPTGDSTYLRKDAGNSPVTGPLAINNSLTVSGTGTFTGPTIVKNLNTTRFADQFTGATADVQINAAIADLPASGGIVDARGYGSSTVTIANPIIVGNTSKPVVLIYSTTTNFQVSVTGGVCAVQIGNGSAVSNEYGAGSPQATSGGTGQWQLTSTANVSSLVCNGDQSGAQEYFTWRGGYITAAAGATVSNALMDINRVGINSIVEDVVFATSPGTSIGLRIRNVQGIRVDNVWSIQNGNGVSIEDSFNVIVTQLMSEQCQAASCYHLQIQRVNETLSAQGTVAVYGYHCEYPPAGGDTKTCLLLDGADETIIDGFTTSNLSGANPITSAVKIVNTSGGTLRNSYTIRHFKHLANGLTNLINDTISTRVLATATYGSKYREMSSSGESTDLKIDMGDPAGASVSRCLWHTTGANSPFCWAYDSAGVQHFGFFGNPDAWQAFSNAISLPAGNYFEFVEGAAATGAATKDRLWGDSADHMVHSNLNNGGVQNLPITAAVTGSNYTNATTTFSTVTPMSFAVAASRNYTLSCHIYFQGSATTAGPKFQLTGPSAPTAVILAVGPFDPIAKTTTNIASGFSTANTTFGTIGATTINYEALVTAGIQNGVNAGTVVLQAAANGAGTLTILPGSWCQLQ